MSAASAASTSWITWRVSARSHGDVTGPRTGSGAPSAAPSGSPDRTSLSPGREGYAVVEPILTLEPTRLAVAPGGQVAFALTVHNPGTVVEGYDLDVVSTTPLPWVSVTPTTLSVYPQQEATAVVTFSPPAGPGAPGGTVPFGVRARSQVDPAASGVVEGDLDVEAVSGLQAMLTPITSSGRWSGRHTVRVSNWGNAPARLRLVASDPDQALGFFVSPDVLEVPLGAG